MSNIPRTPNTYVTDDYNYLSPKIKACLEKDLAEYDKKTSNEVIVYILNSPNGEDPKEFAFKAFNAWGIGKKDKDNGVVLFIFVHGQIHSWVTVGWKLEDKISVQEATKICKTLISPLVEKGMINSAAMSVELLIKEIEK
jgi:uncharacterized protein